MEYAKRLLERGVDATQHPEKAALIARERFGARLPEGALGEEAYRVYVRLYGTPLREEGTESLEVLEGGDEEDGGVELLREGEGGALEEVEVEVDDAEEVGAEMEMDDIADQVGEDDMRLRADIEAALSFRSNAETAQQEQGGASDDPSERAHPITAANRFGTSPTTLPLPTHSVLEPIAAQLATTKNKHLSETAHNVLGGLGLPYGPATPNRLKTMQAKPLQIDAFQHDVSGVQGDVFLAAILPPVYASVMAVLTETRKRLGTKWAEDLVRKAEEGELRILDAGGAGAGVLAVREMLRAEWERMHEESSLDSGMALAEAGGKLGGAGLSPPLGDAAVVTGSDVLRHRAAKLLENTTFIPRLPDYVHTAAQKTKGKFDIVIAPHTLWGGFRFDRERKTHVQNLWSLLDAEGGVLCLLEKGVGRGFEVVAGAREMLLRTRIQSAGSKGTEFDEDSFSGAEIEWEGPAAEEEMGEEVEDTGKGWKSRDEETSVLVWEKEKGTIIAPCTNHVACPMYRPRGFLKGRRDVCAFEQRYVRPPFLQRILGAKDKNFEDVAFSYLSVMRGRDLLEEQAIAQDEEATERAFVGHEASAAEDVSSLSLPRQVLPPLKKKGHVLLDLCTPSGALERWTVPRSFSKRAFRDARKSSWGDLWAMGAKTRILRTPKVDSKHGGRLTKEQRAEVQAMASSSEGRTEKMRVGAATQGADGEGGLGRVLDTDEYGRIVVADVSGGGNKSTGVRIVPGRVKGEGGKMRTGRKVAGWRDKRDKSGMGNGRRKMRWSGGEEE